MFIIIFKYAQKRLILDTCDDTVTRVTECQFKAYNNEVKIYDYSDKLDVSSTSYSIFKEKFLDVYQKSKIDGFLNYILGNDISISFNLLLQYFCFLKNFRYFPSSYKEYKDLDTKYNKLVLQLKYRDSFSKYISRDGNNIDDVECLDKFINKFSGVILDSSNKCIKNSHLRYMYDEKTNKVFISTHSSDIIDICYVALLNNTLDRLEHKLNIYTIKLREKQSKLAKKEELDRQRISARNLQLERERAKKEQDLIERKKLQEEARQAKEQAETKRKQDMYNRALQKELSLLPEEQRSDKDIVLGLKNKIIEDDIKHREFKALLSEKRKEINNTFYSDIRNIVAKRIGIKLTDYNIVDGDVLSIRIHYILLSNVRKKDIELELFYSDAFEYFCNFSTANQNSIISSIRPEYYYVKSTLYRPNFNDLYVDIALRNDIMKLREKVINEGVQKYKDRNNII